jgi:hypothetical protein
MIKMAYPFEAEENAEAIASLCGFLYSRGMLAETRHDGSPIEEAATDVWTVLADGSSIVNSDICPSFHDGCQRTIKIHGEELEVVGGVAFRPAAGGLSWLPAFPTSALAESESGELEVTKRYNEMGLLVDEEGMLCDGEPIPVLYPVLFMDREGELRLTGYFSLTKESAWAPIPADIREKTLIRLLEATSKLAREIWAHSD